MISVKKLIPILIILFLMAALYLLGAGELFTFEELKKHHAKLASFAGDYPVLAPLLFILLYFIVVALSLPGGAMLSLAGGFLFPQPFSTLYVLIGATSGALCIFLAARTALRGFFERMAAERLRKMQKGFRENAAGYLLFLRLVPAFPFWLVNIAPAFFDVRLSTYIWTTFLGIIPGVFVFTQAGAGLASILEREGEFSLNSIFTVEIRIALAALALFALLPAAVKKLRKKVRKEGED